MKKNKNPIAKTAYIILLILILLCGYITIDNTAGNVSETSSSHTELSEGWVSADGLKVDLGDLSELKVKEWTVLENTLPDELSDNDSLNFNSHNSRFRVYMDDPSDGNAKPVYEFVPGANLAGEGCGDVFHHISLSKSLAGEKIYLEVYPVYSTSSSFEGVLIESEREYNEMIIHEKGFSFFLSLVIIFLSIAILMLRLGIPNEGNIMSLTGLGIASVFMGLWSAIETTIPSLIFGYVPLIRVADYLLLPLSQYPMILFINSVTIRRRKIYENISIAVTWAAVAATLIGRLGFGKDLHYLPFLPLTYTWQVVFVIIILVDDYIYKRKNKRKQNLILFNIGTAAFLILTAIDLIIYQLFGKSYMDNGSLIRIGLVIFLILLYLQITRMMSRVELDINSNRFINELLQYSMLAESPEKIISQMLEFIGIESGSTKVYVSERNTDGSTDETYVWKREGDEEKAHADSGEKLEEPLVIDGEELGSFGIDNPIADALPQVEYSGKLIAFFMSVILRQRNNENLLRRYSYRDQMTGVLNRRALNEFVKGIPKDGKHLGVLMCDINGLKKANDEQGHEAGDAMICDIANALSGVFGTEEVYRMGGDEFLAISNAKSEEDFSLEIRMLLELINSIGRSAAVGSAWGEVNTDTFEMLQGYADKRMYADKRAYYMSTGHDRRSR